MIKIKKSQLLCFLIFLEEENKLQITEIKSKNIEPAKAIYNQPNFIWEVVFLCLSKSVTLVTFTIRFDNGYLHTDDCPSFLFFMNKIMIKGGVKVCADNVLNNNNCDSPLESSGCDVLGPFLAINKNCVEPQLPVNAGTVIPFASGITPVNLSTLANGVIDVPSFIGFGTALPGVTVIGD